MLRGRLETRRSADRRRQPAAEPAIRSATVIRIASCFLAAHCLAAVQAAAQSPVLSVTNAVPTCGARVTDLSVRPEWTFRLTPAPVLAVQVEYRRVDSSSRPNPWSDGPTIQTDGFSSPHSHDTFLDDVLRLYPSLRGYQFRLKDDPDVTTSCTWTFVPAVSLSVRPNPVTEGSTVEVRARTNIPVRDRVIIPLTLTAGTAETGDYGALASITIDSGLTSGTGTITTTDDADQDDETFTVALGSLPSSVLAGATSSVQVTITDGDAPAPTVSLSAAPNPVTEGSSVTVTARLSAALSSDVAIPLTLTADSAEAGDYGAPPSITITAGSTTGAGTIATNDDADQDDETFVVALGNLPSSVERGAPSAVVVTIADDDGPSPRVSLSAAPNPVTEGSSVTVTARLSTALSSDVAIPLTLTADSAEAGDYGALPSITITAGSTTGAGTIATNDDADQDDETFVVALGNLPSSVERGTPSAVVVTIADDDGPSPRVSLSAAPNPVTEGSSVTVTARLSTALSSDVAIPLTLTADTAETDDYGAPPSITITAGSTTGTGTIATNHDADQDDETFVVALGNLPSSVERGTPSVVVVTITDDDDGTPTTPRVSLSAAPNPVTEGSSVTVTARLSAALSRNVTIPLTLTAGAAEAGDYGALSSITITAGSTTGAGTIATNDDADQDDETFLVQLGNLLPSSVAPGNPSAVVVTITDGDGVGGAGTTVSLSAAPNPVTEGSSVTVTARLSAALSRNVTIPLTLAAGAAEAGDYGALSSITITAGSTTGAGTIATNDDADQDDEDFWVMLGNLPPSVTPGNPPAVQVKITDDDGLPPLTPTVSLSAAPNPIAEGSSMTVTARLSAALSSDVTIPLTLTPVTAETDDYGALPSITITAGSITGAGTIAANHDADEDDETFLVQLGDLPASVAPGSPSAVVVTITDDDGVGGASTTVSLSAAPNPIAEGSSVTVTAQLSAVLPDAVTIPLTLTPVTAEAGDYGALPSITITAGSTTGAGSIAANHDADRDDETFTVALGNLPSSVTRGDPNAVLVTIADDDTPSTNRSPTVSVSCGTGKVSPGDELQLVASASDPDGDGLAYAWSASGGRFTGPTNQATARWRAPAGTGRVTFRVTVTDGWSATASAECAVEVGNAPPAFEAPTYRFALRENEDGRRRPVALGTVEARDPDGDEVTYSLVSGGRGRFAVGARDGAVTYVGAGEDYETPPNRYELTVRARDPHGAAALARVVVDVVNTNSPPVAVDDVAVTIEDGQVVIDVLSNDTDPNGDPLRVESVLAPAHGTARAVSGGAGGVVYTPAADYHGPDRFTYVAADLHGATATATVSVTVVQQNDAPTASGVISDQTLDEAGSASTVDASAYFEDIDGHALTYRASSSDADVVAVAVAGALVTLTPVAKGSAVVTVTAADPDGATAAQVFKVGVSDQMVRAVLGDTLAAMARSHLASVRMTLARHVAASDDGSRLTVLGRSASLDKVSAQSAAAQLLAGWAVGAGGYGGGLAGPGPGHGAVHPVAGMGGGPAAMRPGPGGGGAGGFAPGVGLGGFAPGGLGAASFAPGVGAGGSDAFGGFGVGMDPLAGSAFQLALGGGEEETAGETGLGERWQVWGQADVQTFAGSPSAAGYEGDVRTGYVGVDTTLSEHWLAGVAVSRSTGGGDWRAGSARGALSTKLTTVYPYAQWSYRRNSVWAAAGGGWGSAENRQESGRVGTGDLGLRLGLAEMRQELDPVRGVDFVVMADAAWAQLRTDTGEESVDGQAAAVHQMRAGAEASRLLRWDDDLSLLPFGELHLRRDGGAGQTGVGVEVAGGMRLAHGWLRVDAQGRLLVLHSAAGYRERGVGVTISGGDRDREGLSLSVSPRWGDAATAGGTLWQEQVYQRYLSEPTGDAWALDARGEYGMRLPRGGLLAWFGSLSQSAYGRRFLVGGRIGVLSPGR